MAEEMGAGPVLCCLQSQAALPQLLTYTVLTLRATFSSTLEGLGPQRPVGSAFRQGWGDLSRQIPSPPQLARRAKWPSIFWQCQPHSREDHCGGEETQAGPQVPKLLRFQVVEREWGCWPRGAEGLFR